MIERFPHKITLSHPLFPPSFHCLTVNFPHVCLMTHNNIMSENVVSQVKFLEKKTEGTKAYIPLRRKNIRVESLRWLRPPTRKMCVIPNAKPQRESVEYRWRWVPNAKFLHWPCTFLFCVCRFHSRWVPFFSGIWALVFLLALGYTVPV